MAGVLKKGAEEGLNLDTMHATAKDVYCTGTDTGNFGTPVAFSIR